MRRCRERWLLAGLDLHRSYRGRHGVLFPRSISQRCHGTVCRMLRIGKGSYLDSGKKVSAVHILSTRSSSAGWLRPWLVDRGGNGSETFHTSNQSIWRLEDPAKTTELCTAVRVATILCNVKSGLYESSRLESHIFRKRWGEREGR